MAIGIKLTGLKEVLKTFDEHGWKGSFTRGLWEIGNGGYDCWFELKYEGLSVARCINGTLENTVDFSVYFTEDQKDKVFDKILEVYDHLTVKKSSLNEKIRQANNIRKNLKELSPEFQLKKDEIER